TFQLVDGIAIYGGFSGTETVLEERDWNTNVTILSGDIGVMGGDTDNSFHVTTGNGNDATAVLDGFTVTKGRADDVYPHNLGGGMINNDGGNPTLTNLIFTENYASTAGGGMVNRSYSSPTLTNVIFWENTAFGVGGAMYNYDNSNPILVNVTLSGNLADGGGGMMNNSSSPTLINTVCWGDSAGGGEGDEIYNAFDEPVISYSLIQGCGGSGLGWNSSLGTDGGNNIDADPLFVDENSGDLHLSVMSSPAVNTGDNAAPFLPPTDLDGYPRICGASVDMGAYEFQLPASIGASPSLIVFTEAPVNQSTCDTIYVVNEGAEPLAITGVYGCQSEPFSMDTTMTDHTLGPQETTEIVVCVTPILWGEDSCAVTIVSDAWNNPVVVPVWLDIVTAAEPDETPQPFRIVSVSPNPFNPSTTVHFTLPAAMPVTAEIYAVDGARIRVLANKQQFRAGLNRLTWDGQNDQGSTVASGVYFIRIETRLGAQSIRGVLLR
ncbi:MAG: T9SS type A sorting domain-containing protein, partial [Candidatus Krumholzibacteriota bacterium]|nr:T9SS type A sorting domain-containing protein [Candidatus Krumholzibacteriota bacterium]